MTPLGELIARVEKGERSRELEVLIYGETHPDKSAVLTWLEAASRAPFYFVSLDAAESLVPRGWTYDCGSGGGGYTLGPWARCYPESGQHDGTGDTNVDTTKAALVLAALRARASGEAE